MSLLFEVSPEEPEAKKAKGRRTPENGSPGVAFEPTLSRPSTTAPVVFFGRADFDDLVCIDDRCQGTAHDIVDEDGRRWLVSCAYCGSGQWVRARGQARKPAGESFRFPSGRFSGLSIAETVVMENGLEYVQCASESHKHTAAREACQAWLAQNQPGR